MSETRYTVELAKSGRAKCKRCKETIGKGTMRIGTHSNNGDFDLTSWNCVGCFKLPRKYASGANKMSAEDFVRQVLEDTSDGDILPDRLEEIVAGIETATGTGGRKSTGKGSSEAASGPIGEIKEAYEKEQAEIENGKEPSSKKSKSNFAAKLDAYATYKGCKNPELKDMLKWNRQVQTGTKDLLMAKVIDGKVYGRLAVCSLCTGRLKMTEDGNSIQCSGKFDEDMQMRIPCNFSCVPADAPRWKPWYEAEPTEEEAAEIDRLIEEADNADGKENSASNSDQVAALQKAVANIQWELGTTAGLKKAVTSLTEVLLSDKLDGKKLDIPQGQKQAKMKIGEVVTMNKDKTIEEIVPILVDHFGFAEDKKAKADKKQAALEQNLACAANAPVVAVLQELAELYFKEGNRNAGSSYKKAVAAVSELEYEITADNAKKLGAGKQKVAGIGKGTADKIYEFMTTGTMEKLEEKRAAAA